MTQTEVSILKNAVLDATEAYVDARLAVLDFVKTQIGIVQSYTEKNHKFYHVVKCNNGRVTYNNVLSVGNIPFPANSTVFLIAPNAQYSNQFILGKLDDTPCSIRGGSININDKFIVNPDGSMIATDGTFKGAITGGSININDKFIVDRYGKMQAVDGEFTGAITGGSININDKFIVNSYGKMTAIDGAFTGTITGGSININDNFIVNSNGEMTANAGTFKGTVTGGSININNKFKVNSNGEMTAELGTFKGTITGGSIDINSNFVVTPEGIMKATNGEFEGEITGGSININDAFIVDDDGNMTATAGKIGNLFLEDGRLYTTKSNVPLVENKKIVATSKKQITKTVKSFVPSQTGFLSDFKLIFVGEENPIIGDRSATLKLQYKNSSGWVDIESFDLSSSTVLCRFQTVFSYSSITRYRIIIVFSATTSIDYRRTFICNVYTDGNVVTTALDTDGYSGKIVSYDANIGGIRINSEILSTTDSDYENGFFLSEEMFILNSSLTELLSYRPYGVDQTFNYAGLFVGGSEDTEATGITLAQDRNNYFRLADNGDYYVMINGTGSGGTIQGGSDRRIKENITALDIEMSKNLIDSTNTYKFKYKNRDGFHYGVIAQEAREVLDNLGETNAQLEYGIGDMFIDNQRNVNYEEYIPPLINYVKGLKEDIEELKSIIKKEDK